MTYFNATSPDNFSRNAKELIADFWNKSAGKKKAGRKSVDPKGKESPSVSASKRGRSLTSKDKSPAVDSSSAGVKRVRGKGKSAKTVSEDDGVATTDEEAAADEDGAKRGKKKARQSGGENGRAKRKSLGTTNRDAEGDVLMENGDVEDVTELYQNMNKYMAEKNWETLVQKVDTVERTEDNSLIVYFTL